MGGALERLPGAQASEAALIRRIGSWSLIFHG
jgi:hypothetical protein